MIRPVVVGHPAVSELLLVGQAPGSKEGVLQKPFAWTAGKTLFRWFSSIGVSEEEFRSLIYMAAVCRCFPGKNPKGGDRVPDEHEIANCSRWLDRELKLLQPKVVIPVGKLAISQFVELNTLAEVVGKKLRGEREGVRFDIIALPHPSGASTWHRKEPGRTLLASALKLIKDTPSFSKVTATSAHKHRFGRQEPND